MLPRPATIAAPPSTASPVSWNPAVPPPPVTGAPLGTGLGEGLGEKLGDGLGDGLSEGEGLPLTDSVGLGDPPPAKALAVPLTVGENDESGGLPDEVQAESATQASTVVRRPQPTAVSRTRCAVRAMAVHAFIEPPRALGNDHFPVADRRNRRRKKTARLAFGRRPLRPENGPGEKTGGHNTVSTGRETNGQWRAHHLNIRLLE